MDGMLRGLVAAALCVGFAVPGRASAAPCDCLADFDRLTQEIETDYIGFALGVKGWTRDVYEAHRARLRERAARTRGEACVFVLRALTDWFDDGHLFVVEAPGVDTAETVRLAAARERVDRTEAELRAYLEANAGRLDPIEGIWYDRGLRVAVVRDSAPGRDFVAITLAAGSAAWRPGMIRAEIRVREGGAYDVVYYAGDQSTRHLEAHVWKGILLRMPPVVWGKEFPLAPHERGLLDPDDPRAPTFRRLDDRAVLFSIPSHDPARAATRLAELVEANRAEILAAEIMIVDLRGNEGGSSYTTRVLAPFYYAEPLRPPLAPSLGVPAILASTDHIARAEANLKKYPRQPPGVLELVEAMRRNPGEVVPFPAALANRAPFRPDTVFATPRHVAILVDGGAVSAAEAFLLEAGRSPRVTIFGENSGGVIDYQNVHLVRLACRTRGLLLGYPEIAASDRLPAGGLNATGIAPHVRIPRGVADWIDFVLAHYGNAGA